MRAVARAGLAARGVIYILIGWVAILVAAGHSSRQPDQEGALRLLAGTPYGLVSLLVLGVGFACYALWLVSQAAFGVTGQGDGAGQRLGAAGRAVVYAFLAYLTFKVITGAGGNAIIGVVLIAQGLRARFMRNLMSAQMSARTRKAVVWLGRIGVTSRGAVFTIAGALVIDAAVTSSPRKSGGLDKALLTLRQQPYGEVLLLIAAVGLVVFGLYGLAEARWRKV
jgi:hypothetical protein